MGISGLVGDTVWVAKGSVHGGEMAEAGAWLEEICGPTWIAIRTRPRNVLDRASMHVALVKERAMTAYGPEHPSRRKRNV
jgi:hypothetical protein